MKVHLALRLIGTPTSVWIKFQTTSCQSTLRRTSPNKTKKIGDDATVAAVPLAEGTQLLELSALHTDRETGSKTWTKQPIMLLTVL